MTGDRSRDRARRSDEIGRRELDLEPTPTGRHEQGLECERCGVDDGRQAATLAERADPTTHVAGHALGLGRIRHLRLPAAERPGERFEIELGRDRNDGHGQPPVDARDERLVDPRRIGPEGRGGIVAPCRSPAAIGPGRLMEVVLVDRVGDARPLELVERPRPAACHRARS